MPVRRSKGGRWRYRHVVKLPNGDSVRISGSAPRHHNTRAGAEEEMLVHIDRTKHPERYPKPRREVPTFEEWFEGRFWREWVIGRKNKPSEQASKKRLYKNYVKPFFGPMYLDEIGVSQVAQFRADLVEGKQRKCKHGAAPLSDKYINNILAVLSKALKYAEDSAADQARAEGWHLPHGAAGDRVLGLRPVRAASRCGQGRRAGAVCGGLSGRGWWGFVSARSKGCAGARTLT